MKDWTIRSRIAVSFGLILALMVVMAAVAYTRLTIINQEAVAVRDDSVPGLYFGTSLLTGWSNDFLIAEQRILQADPAQRQKLDARLAASRGALDTAVTAYERTVFDQQDRDLLAAFKTARATYLRVEDDVTRASDKERTAEGLERLNQQLSAEFDKGTAPIEKLVDANRGQTEASVKQITGSVSNAQFGVLASLAVAVLLAIACGVGLFRLITRPLGALVARVQASAVQVNTSVTEVGATAKEQQATSNEIAATTTEIGATSREISATAKELVKTMNDVSTVAEQSASVAGTGQAGLTHMEDTMRHVMEAAGSVNAKLTTLSEKAADISLVVTTITKVADQTNLLSLNAAIEAEKAGEHGRGFSVVATEIRRLADQTAVATYDIDQMVKAIQSAVSAGVMSMDKFSEEVRSGMHAVKEVSGVLTQVIQQTQALAPRFESVTEGMQTQATGAEQITESLIQLGEAARQTVESLRQSNIAIDDLNQVARGLRDGVSEFTLQVA